jgi:DNA-directed RNA polymerase specialized sigma24 family protein
MAANDRAIDGLPPNHRSALRQVIAGATPAGVAAELGAADSNLVRTWLHRARQRLAPCQARSN